MSLSRKEWMLAGLAGIILLAFLSWHLLKEKGAESEAGSSSLKDAEVLLQAGGTGSITENPEKPANPVVIDIKGEVKNPGVYRLMEGDRVEDAVNKAGGLTADADQTQVNLASKAIDGMMIVIPKTGEHSGGSTDSSAADSSGKVNINMANAEQLQTIPGVGPSKAKMILEYREKNGPFETAEDLLEVSGIGEKSLENMDGYIEVP
ncbi:helix-hairpin-helix domain-containing protein [Bacillus marinisedimentorum]|uniref:helix-hairpin-helix domain-containing protein n=1 Tax=Bacillus marinisedimentorum TaxID=1821260 RepID=UPI0008733F6E|nr:helix-hairpin-helix domain-containing protein [Bacillus marinisedimentorum]